MKATAVEECPMCRFVAPGSSCGFCNFEWALDEGSPGFVLGAPSVAPEAAEDPLHVLLGHLAHEGRSVATIDEVAPLLGLGRTAAYEAVKRKEIPVIRLGRKIRVPIHSLARILGMDVTPPAHDGALSPLEVH